MSASANGLKPRWPQLDASDHPIADNTLLERSTISMAGREGTPNLTNWLADGQIVEPQTE